VTRYNKCIADAEMALSEATGKTGKQLKQLRELQASVKTLTAQPGDPAASRDYGERLSECGLMLARVKSIEPDTGSLFVRLFLGQVNVRVASKEDRGRLKDEYEKFRFRTNFGFIIFPLIWILDFWYLRSVWKYTYWLYILTHVWLLYYYVSLALRTNILKVVRCINSPTPPPPPSLRARSHRAPPPVHPPLLHAHILSPTANALSHTNTQNGSQIKEWWIYHHYVSAFMAIVVLTWPPESRSFDGNMPYFTAYFLYQGLVQFVQWSYQSERHYHRKALGDAREMDVAQTETIVEFHSGFWPLVSLLCTTYLCQIMLGLRLWSNLVNHLSPSQPWYSFREETQCALLGSSFILLGVMNAYFTVSTILEKWAKEREKKGKGKAATASGSPPPNPPSAAAAAAPSAQEQRRQPQTMQPPFAGARADPAALSPGQEETGAAALPQDSSGIRYRGVST
jgi:hypothetical protein